MLTGGQTPCELTPCELNTGLFFFRGNSKAPFSICNAGGGFSYVGAMHDSFPHALELSKLGYNAFALIYRPGDAYEDLARAITYICDHADELGVSLQLTGGQTPCELKADFKGILEAMDGLPVNIRLLDPPLHEFVPHDLAGQETMAKEMGVSVEDIKRRVDSLAENNPMLGHRGCRLGITFPEITAMQTRAILGAACELKKEGKNPMPEIMVPLIGTLYELKQQKEVILEAAKEVFAEYGIEVEFEIGTMIEIPRAALTADRIATEAQYFSFGTNDLTQMTFGYSRDDIASFLPVYLDKKILKVDPFQVLDQKGVGKLIKYAVEKGREVRPELRCGICGEHGGEPSSVKFCAKIGMNYASCSPFRVPIARLAAAQAAVEE